MVAGLLVLLGILSSSHYRSSNFLLLKLLSHPNPALTLRPSACTLTLHPTLSWQQPPKSHLPTSPFSSVTDMMITWVALYIVSLSTHPLGKILFISSFHLTAKLIDIFQSTWVLIIWLHFTLRGFPDGSAAKESACNAGDAGDLGSIPGLGRFPGAGNGNPLQYSCLENPMDRGAWWAMVRRKGHKQLDTIGRPGTHCWKSKHNFLQAFWWTRKIYLDPLHCKYSGREVNFLGFFWGRIIKITFEINIFNNNGKVWLKT